MRSVGEECCREVLEKRVVEKCCREVVEKSVGDREVLEKGVEKGVLEKSARRVGGLRS